jgi:hypothetical protein
MKITCECGHTIPDVTDNLPYKAHLIPDKNWDTFWDAIDDAIEKSGPTAADKERACMALRKESFGHRFVWQCPKCGRLYVDDRTHNLQCFVPATASVPKDLFTP